MARPLVPDSRDERSYVPALEPQGFELVVREPWWYEHRCLRHQKPACNLHVFSPNSAEAERHLIFRDWLRSHPEDCSRYAAVKPPQPSKPRQPVGTRWTTTRGRNRDIYDRAFRALGLVT